MAFLGLSVVSAPIAAAEGDGSQSSDATPNGGSQTGGSTSNENGGTTGGTTTGGQTGNQTGTEAADPGDGSGPTGGTTGTTGTTGGSDTGGVDTNGTGTDPDGTDPDDEVTAPDGDEDAGSTTPTDPGSTTPPAENVVEEPADVLGTGNPQTPNDSGTQQTNDPGSGVAFRTADVDGDVAEQTGDVQPLSAALDTTDPTPTATPTAAPLTDWGWPLDPYPDVPGFTKTEVAAVAFLVLAAGTISSLTVNPLLAIPLGLMTLTAFGRLVQLGYNQAPTATYQQTSQVLGVVEGDVIGYDPDGDELEYSISLSQQGTQGLAFIDPNTGHYTYTAYSLGILGVHDTFYVTVYDHMGIRDISLAENPLGEHKTVIPVTVDIPGIIGNSSPVFDSDPEIISTNNETGVLTGRFKAHDPEGASLSFGSVAVLGSVDINDEVDEDGYHIFTYTPHDPHAASGDLAITTDLVTITVSDGNTLPAARTFTVHLATTVNDLPEATYQNTGGSSLLGTVTGKIVITADDDVVHAYTPAIITTEKGSVVVSPLTGDYIYTASLSARQAASASDATPDKKIDTFTITVNDLHGGTTDVEVTVTIPTINIDPVGGVPVGTLGDDNGIVRGSIEGVINLDNDPLTYSIKGATGADITTAYTGAGGIAHVNSDGSYIYIPKASDDSVISDSFTVVVSDGRGGTSEVLVAVGVLSLTSPLKNVDVSQTNTSPGVVTGGLSLSSTANTNLFTNLTANGQDYGDVVFNGRNYTYTRTATGHVGGTSDTFDVYGTAYGLTIKMATVTVTPTIANAAPTAGTTTITSSSLTDVLGVYWQHTEGKVVAADADGDAVSYPGGLLGQLITTDNGATVMFYDDGTFTYTQAKFRSYYHAASATNASGNDLNDTFQITVTDSFGASSTLTVYVPIEKVNDNPDSSASISGSSTDALGVVRGTLSGNDDDDDALSYTLAGAGNPAGATATSSYTANGGIVYLSGKSIVYIPTKSGSTTDTFKVLVSDGHGGTSVATVSVSQSTPSPTANIDTSTAGVVTGKLNVPAADAGLLTYSLGTGPAKGSVTVNADGTFNYQRTAGLGHTQTPGDSFTIKGTDADGKVVTIATINVTPVVENAAPVGAGVTTSAPVGAPTYNVWGGPSDYQETTGTLHATDADGDALTFAAGTYTTANGGEVTVTAGGAFSYSLTKFAPFGIHSSYWHDHAVDGDPGDTFTVNVSDGFGGTTAVTYSIPIAKLNEVPDASVSVGNKATDGLGVVRGTVTGSDDDDDSLSYSLVGAAAGSVYGANGGVVTLSGNAFTYIPKVGVTSDSFQVSVYDGHGGTSTATVTLTGLSTPSPTSNINTATPNQVTGKLAVPAGDTALFTSFAKGSDPGKGTVTVNSDGSFTYTRTVSGHSQTPADSFTIVATTASGKTVVLATINVTPTVANNVPVANGLTVTSMTITEDTILFIPTGDSTAVTKGTLKAIDADPSDTVTFTAGTYTSAHGGSLVLSANGTFTYEIDKPNSYYHSVAADGAGDTVSVAVTDGFGGNVNLTYTIPVVTSNNVPASTVTVTKTADGLGVVRGTITGSDGDNDTLTYTLIGATSGSAYTANNGIVSLSGNTYTYVPKVGVGSDSFQVTVYDGHGGTSTATVSLTGLSTPSPTTVVSSGTNTVTVALTVPPADAGLLTFSKGSDGLNGTVVRNPDGTYTYTRTALGHTAPQVDYFTITATDASGKTVTIANVMVTPDVVNNAPTATLTTAPTEGKLNGTVQTSTGKITAADVDPGDLAGLTYVVTGLASGASVTFASDGSFTYTNNLSIATRHAAAKYGATAAQKNQTFTVTVKDGFGGSAAPITVTVPIYAVNSAPTISGGKAALTATIETDDADGDSIDTNKNPAPGESGYVLSNGGTLVGILDVGVLYTTLNYPLTVTVWDGYYVVTNPDPVTGLGGGHVTSTLSSTSKTYS